MNWAEVKKRCNVNDPYSLLSFFFTGETYLNLPLQVLHNKVIPLTIGKEIIFDSEKEEIIDILDNWANKTQLYKKCKLLLAQLSFFGKGVAFMLKDEEGFCDLWIPAYQYTNYVAKINEKDKVCVVWCDLMKGDNPSRAKVVIKPGVISIQYYGLREVRASNETTTKMEEFPVGKPQVFKSDTNYFPAREFINKQTTTFGLFNNSTFAGVPDWWNGKKLLIDIDDSMEQKYRERAKNQTRIFGSFDQQKINDLQKGKISLEGLLGDLVLSVNSDGYQHGGGNNIQAVVGNPNFETYHKDIAATTTLFYETCGYNYRAQDTDGEYENKTKSIMNNDLDIQTTAVKQQELKEGLYYLIDIMLGEEGFPQDPKKRDYSINFNSASITDDIRNLDIVERRLKAGLISRTEALQLLDGDNKLVAQERLKKIDEDMINSKVMEQMSFNDDEGEFKQDEQMEDDI